MTDEEDQLEALRALLFPRREESEPASPEPSITDLFRTKSKEDDS